MKVFRDRRWKKSGTISFESVRARTASDGFGAVGVRGVVVRGAEPTLGDPRLHSKHRLGHQLKTGRQQLLPSRDLSNQAAITRQAEVYEF
jgi:hypothetical protein